GRNLGRLVVRPIKATCDASRGVQSTKECLAAETRQQERPDRCQEIGRAFAPWSAFGGLPRRAWPAHVEGIVPQLFNHQQGSRAGDESAQGVVSELGHSLCWGASLCTAPSRRMASKNYRSRRAPASGTLLRTTRRAAVLAKTSQERTAI